MIGVYFSGTGNSRYCLEKFLQYCDNEAKAFSIEDETIIKQIHNHKTIIFSYPVQYSNIPKILKDFIDSNQTLWEDKEIFVIATMGMFSGDGSGILARLLKKYGAKIIGGLHLKMPDSISDEKVLKRSLEDNKKIIQDAQKKIQNAAECFCANKPTREGIGLFYHLAGLFGQRLYFGHKTKKYSDKLKISTSQCIGCGKCEKLCPMKNISINNKKAVAKNQCTMCYRCINNCPKQAITLLGKQVITQSIIEKYL